MPDFTARRVERESDDTGDHLQERQQWLLRRRVGPDGTLDPVTLARASRQKRAMQRAAQRLAVEARAAGLAPTAAATVDPYWTPLGPSVVAHGQATGHPVVSGRVAALAVGPAGTRVYLGAANGGVWYSEDTGATWTPIDEYALPPPIAQLSKLDADSLSTGAIAVRFGATAAQDEIYVGTGEPPGPVSNPSQYFGVGIKHSTSGGSGPAWALEATNLAGMGVYRILVDPEQPEVVFAATTQGLFMRPRSGSNFVSWTPVAVGAAGSAITDLVIAGAGGNKVYFAAVSSGSIFRSSNATKDPGGGTWTQIAGFGGSGRVALAASENAGAPIVYALDEHATLWRLDDAPNGNFVLVAGIPKGLFFGRQGGYDIVLGVDPSNSNTVYVAGDAIVSDDWNLPFFKGTVTLSSGKYVFPFDSSNDMTVDAHGDPKDSSSVHNDATWIGKGVHPDAHCIAFATNADGTHDPTNVWLGCDGGVFQSTQNGANGTFQAHNKGLAVTQITYLAQHPLTDEVLIAGAQDQGTVRFRGDQVGFEDPEGDGGGCAYDPNDGYRVMRQYIHADLYTATDGGNGGDSSWTGLKNAKKFPPIVDSSQQDTANTESKSTGFYAPIAAVAVDTTHTLAAFGTNRLWITKDWGDSWYTIPSNTNPYMGPAANILDQDKLDGAVTAIAWASPTQIYVATATSVYRFDQNGNTWTPNPPVALPAGLPAGCPINSIGIEDPAAGKIFVALGGSGQDHVWHFDGAAWASASLAVGTLDVPCHAIVVDPVHPERLYVGTDVGVFTGVKNAATWDWTLFGNNLPESAVRDLAIHPKTRVLRAATQGLGIWEIPLDVTKVADPDVYLRANSADAGRAPRPSFLHGMPDPTLQGTTLDLVSSPDIKVLRSSRSQLNTTPDFLDFASLRDFETDLNTFDTLGTNQIFVSVHNRGKTPVDAAQLRVLLLLADGSAALPALPADFASRIQNGDTTAWLTAGWHFADPSNPYRTLASALDVRIPQVVQYNVSFTSLGFNASKVAAAAFVTADADPFTSTETDANALIVPDKHVAVRVLEVGVDWRVVLGIVLVAVGVGVAIGVAAGSKK